MNLKQKKIEMMKKEKIPTLLFKFGIPAIIGLLINAIYNVVDTLFVSRLGITAVGATAIVFPIYFIMSGIGLTFGTGAASNISRLMGKNNRKEANIIASTAFFSSIVIAILLVILGTIFLLPILDLLGVTETMKSTAVDYSGIYIIATGGIILNITLNNIIRSEGSAKYSMVALISGALLNMILDPIFIYNFKLGVKGAAIATLIAQVISIIISLIYFYSERSYVKLSIKYIKLSKNIICNILKIGLPNLGFQFLSSITMGMLNTAVAVYGDYAVASMGIANRFFSLGMFVIFGFSKGLQPIIGYNYGAKEFKRLNIAINTSLKWVTYFCISASILQILFSRLIISIFSKDKLVVKLGSKILIINNLTFIFLGIITIYSSIFLAIGDGRKGAILSTAKGILFIPILLMISKFLGINGVITSQAIADILAVIITFYFSLSLKKRIKLKTI